MPLLGKKPRRAHRELLSHGGLENFFHDAVGKIAAGREDHLQMAVGVLVDLGIIGELSAVPTSFISPNFF